MKNEILKAIGTIEIHYSDFDHDYDWSKRTYAKCIKTVESENYNIEVEFEEEARWTAPDDYDIVNLAVAGIKITDENGLEIETDIKDKEILTAINY
jgi:hypothetical protein